MSLSQPSSFINPMTFSIDRSRSSARPLDFQGYSRGGMTLNDAGELTPVHEDDAIMVDSPRAFGVNDTFMRPKNNLRMVVDLTSDDDIVEESMKEEFTARVQRSNCPSAEPDSSAVRAFHQTASRNISSIHNRFAPLSAGNNDSFLVQALREMDMDMVHVTRRTRSTNLSQQVHDSDMDMANADESIVPEHEIHDLTGDMAHVKTSFTSSASNSSGNQTSSCVSIGEVPNIPEDERYTHVINGIVYKPGMCLQFKDGSFMKVTDIYPQPDDLRFAGRRLFRSTDSHCDTFLPKLQNELIWLTQMDAYMSSNNIKRIVNIRFTNHRTHFREDAPMLTCRLKLTMRQSGVIIMWGRAPITADDNSIEYLQYHETDPGFGKWSNELRAEWRGMTVPFGEAEKSSLALENERKGRIDLDPDRAYTFGDAYCGGGGVSCGANQAGFKIKWATDYDKHALNTYQLNFEDVEIERAEFYDFLTNSSEFLRVDVAHCSPPCQTWSPAHTVASANDDANSACVFSGVDLAMASKCRILTIEETSGLVTRHVLYFNRIVLSLVELGYAVRWSILSCDHYGVPQERKRVMVIAAGPGEILPHYPDPTHGNPGHGGNLQRRENIGTTISRIPVDADDHDLAKVRTRWQNSHRQAFSDKTLARTITCGGGEFNYHPSGTRAYTDREMAVLQTFPMDYQFSGKFTRKQIGNAVPPRFAKAVYSEVIRSLQETDKEEAEGKFN